MRFTSTVLPPPTMLETQPMEDEAKLAILQQARQDAMNDMGSRLQEQLSNGAEMQTEEGGILGSLGGALGGAGASEEKKTPTTLENFNKYRQLFGGK